MFKALIGLLHRTQWWVLIAFGLGTVLLLIVVALPFNVMRLSAADSGPAQARAIQRQIDSAFADNALNLAEHAVEFIQRHSSDPVRKAELQRTLADLARARADHIDAVATPATGVGKVTAEQIAQLERDIEAATDSFATTVDARQSIADNLSDLEDALRAANVPEREWPTHMKGQIDAAKAAEDAAKARLDELHARLDQAARALERQETGADDAGAVHIIIGGEVRDPATAPPAPALPVPPVPPGDVKTPVPPVLDLLPAPPPPPRPGELSAELRDEIHRAVDRDFLRLAIGALLILLFVPVFFVVVIAKIFIDRARGAQRLAEEKSSEAEAHNMRRQLIEARLAALQAQVEPHFLYNTLANVQALTEIDPPAAGAMVGHLIDYLRAALPKMRENTSTVRQEAELARAYLNILKMRMGSRLEFDIAIDAAAAERAFPPLMLPSLVENAIKHGIEPLRDGGRIEVFAHIEGERLVVGVRDSGRGLQDAPDVIGGVGLANIRERLTGMYGAAAQLVLAEEPGAPLATVARIELPLVAPHAQPAAAAQPAATTVAEAAPNTPAARLGAFTRRLHRAWGRFCATLLMLLLGLALLGLVVISVALLAGEVPVQLASVELTGPSGMALGALGLLAVYAALSVAIVMLVALIYGMGYVVAGLVVVIPMLVLLGTLAPLTPAILLAVLIYWLVKRKRPASPT